MREVSYEYHMLIVVYYNYMTCMYVKVTNINCHNFTDYKSVRYIVRTVIVYKIVSLTFRELKS